MPLVQPLSTAGAVTRGPSALPQTEQDVQETKAYGAGLQNLGNTCYMNATLQCLYRVPELVSALGGLSDGQPAASGPSRISLASKALFRQMQSSNGAPINPLAFLMALRDAFPQFAEPGPGGAPMQQDAEECWSGLLNLLKQRLGADGEGGGVVKELFEIEMASELKCEETGEVWNGRSSQLLLKVRGVAGEVWNGRAVAVQHRPTGQITS